MNQPAASYFICSNPRSGTTLLCDLLTQTGVAGQPDSFFREKSLQDWCNSWGITGPIRPEDGAFSDRYFAALWKQGRGDTPVFGMRVMGPDLAFMQSWLARRVPQAENDVGRINALFGATRFIHLSRQDKVAEAVSYLRAEQSGLWHQRPDGTALERMPPSAPEGYDAAQIEQRMQSLSAYDEAWQRWFTDEGITPLFISYEELADDPRSVLARVLRVIGQDPSVAISVTPGVRKLADAQSAAWIARFRAEKGLAG